MLDTSRPPQRARRRLRISVFAKVATLMVLQSGALVFLVVLYSWGILGPELIQANERIVEQFAHALAATSPDFKTAQDMSARSNVQMRYEGPNGSWTTADNLPTIEEARRHQHGRSIHGHAFYLVSDAHGGTYLFSWDFRQRMLAVHDKMVEILVGAMISVVIIAYVFLRFLLRPLRGLGDGVARLSDGQLDFVVPTRTRDEFGLLTDAFNQMVRRVREMIHARDRLLLDVSHELRSPLTRLKVALELLPEADNDKRAKMAADLAEMEMMIGELLELERLRDGRGIAIGCHDLLSIIRDVAENYRDKAPGVRIVAGVPELPLDVDPDKLRIVIRNLLENAIKYSLPDSRAVQIAVADDERSVVVRVIDDGPGVPECDEASLFEPFFRVDRSRSKKTGGYGLGLSICKRIVEAHGGTIAVERNVGRGASFIVTLPKRA
jgi:signal transduction histidine kinase